MTRYFPNIGSTLADDELPVRSDADMPESIWLCPSDHMEEFYSLHGGTCPSCPRQLVEYRRTGTTAHLGKRQ